MRIATLLKHQVTLPVDSPTLFDWFGREGVFFRLTPPWEKISLISRDPGLEAGNRTHFTIKVGIFTLHWISEQVDYDFNESFCDMQIKGPFSYWKHLHRFRYLSEDSSIMEDTVRYIPPGGSLIHFLFRRQIKHKIKSFFRYRARVMFNDLTCQTRYPSPPLRILIAGGKGFVGQELCAFLQSCGHKVSTLTRTPKKDSEIAWDPKTAFLDPKTVEGFDVWINLAGENIGSSKWNEKTKQKILESRIEVTRLLVNTMNELKYPPETFISASATGYYGVSSTGPQDESSFQGNSFLAEVCAAWEEEANKAKCRVVITRFGLVLSPKGGALKQMLLPFRFGIGGKMGTGEQYISWISMDDLLYQMYHVMLTKTLSGPVNFTTGAPVTNAEFTKILGAVLHRPTFITVPKGLLRLLFGQMGEETLLGSTCAIPKKLADSGSTFAYPTLQKALEHLLPK